MLAHTPLAGILCGSQVEGPASPAAVDLFHHRHQGILFFQLFQVIPEVSYAMGTGDQLQQQHTGFLVAHSLTEMRPQSFLEQVFSLCFYTIIKEKVNMDNTVVSIANLLKLQLYQEVEL